MYRVDEGAKPFLFPLIGPTGAPFTRSFPMKKVAGEDHDHPHQRSFWFTHGKVNGVDFWSEQERHGKIKETSRPTVLSGPVVGRLRTTDDWLGPDGRKVCADERVLTIYRTTDDPRSSISTSSSRRPRVRSRSATPRRACSASASPRAWT